MTNFDVIKKLDEFKLSIFLWELKFYQYKWSVPKEYREWLEQPVDEYFWFQALEILHIDEVLKNGQTVGTT